MNGCSDEWSGSRWRARSEKESPGLIRTAASQFGIDRPKAGGRTSTQSQQSVSEPGEVLEFALGEFLVGEGGTGNRALVDLVGTVDDAERAVRLLEVRDGEVL